MDMGIPPKYTYTYDKKQQKKRPNNNATYLSAATIDDPNFKWQNSGERTKRGAIVWIRAKKRTLTSTYKPKKNISRKNISRKKRIPKSEYKPDLARERADRERADRERAARERMDRERMDRERMNRERERHEIRERQRVRRLEEENTIPLRRITATNTVPLLDRNEENIDNLTNLMSNLSISTSANDKVRQNAKSQKKAKELENTLANLMSRVSLDTSPNGDPRPYNTQI